MFEAISETFSGILRTMAGKTKISEKNVEDAVEEIKVALLDADVNLHVVRRFINGTLEEAKGRKSSNRLIPGNSSSKLFMTKWLRCFLLPTDRILS